MGAPEYFKPAHVVGTDGAPPSHRRRSRRSSHRVHRRLLAQSRWQQTPWLGKWTGKPPTDLFAYQELIWRVRPNWIIETGTQGGGRAFFLATICDLLGNGQVLSIDDYPVEKLAEHPRIAYDPSDPDDLKRRRRRGRSSARTRAIVILAAGRASVLRRSRLYAPLVPVGSYVVVEDTILNGHPVWTGLGPGPVAGVGRSSRSGEFEVDSVAGALWRDLQPEGLLEADREGGQLNRRAQTGFEQELAELLADRGQRTPTELFAGVSDQLWLWINTEGYRASPELREIVPALPDESTQRHWTNRAADEALVEGDESIDSCGTSINGTWARSARPAESWTSAAAGDE